MEVIIDILMILILVLIAWQDFLTREITVLLFPATAVLVVFDVMNTQEIKIIWWNFSINLFFLVMQLLILFYYIRLKYGKKAHLFKNFFGWGDVLVLVSVCCVFSLPGFIFFTLCAGLTSIAIALVYQVFSKKEMTTIPFAGVAALLFLLLWTVGITDYDNLQLFASE